MLGTEVVSARQILLELESTLRLVEENDVILIDDARMFTGPHPLTLCRFLTFLSVLVCLDIVRLDASVCAWSVGRVAACVHV